MWRELTFLADSPSHDVLVIEDDRASLLVDPLRWRILENLKTGRSVSELSSELGVTDARIMYHLNRLVEAGVVQLKGDSSDPVNCHCSPAFGRLRVRTELSELAADASSAIPPEIADQFNQAFREVSEGLYGTICTRSVSHNRARLSEEQAAEFGSRLLALIEEYFPPGKGDQSGAKYGFYGVVTPIDLHPLRDQETQ